MEAVLLCVTLKHILENVKKKRRVKRHKAAKLEELRIKSLVQGIDGINSNNQPNW